MLIISHSMTKVHLLKKSFLTLLMPSWKLNLTTILLLEELWNTDAPLQLSKKLSVASTTTITIPTWASTLMIAKPSLLLESAAPILQLSRRKNFAKLNKNWSSNLKVRNFYKAGSRRCKNGVKRTRLWSSWIRTKMLKRQPWDTIKGTLITLQIIIWGIHKRKTCDLI